MPGVDDLIKGSQEHGIESAQSKIEKGKLAINALKAYKEAKKSKDEVSATKSLKTFRAYERYFGYGYLEKPTDIIPPIALTFYSFHIMVGLGSWFLVLFFMLLYFSMIGKIGEKKWWLRFALFSIPLGLLAGETGWIVAEVGRQPWAIFEMLPTRLASSQISVGAVQTTFWMFVVIFTGLIIAEIKIMLSQIKLGMEGH